MKNIINKYKSFLKFICVGGFNTVLSLVIYYFLKNIGFNYIISMGMSYIITSIIGYFLNKTWVFNSKQSNKSLIKYYILYLSALILNISLMHFQVSVLDLSDNLAPYFTIFVTTIYNYILNKYWVFNKEKIFSLNKIKQYFKENKLLCGLGFVAFIIITFMLVNNLFIHPVADDYRNCTELYNLAPNYTINSLKVYLDVIIKRTVSIYNTWQGTYFSNIFFSLNPLLISTNMYRFVMFLFQIFWIGCIIFFFKSFYNKNDINKKEYLILSFLFIIFSIFSMYSLGEGVYWFTGVVLYLFPFSLSLILFALIIKYIKNNNNFLLIMIGLLAIILGGTSYVTGLFVGFVFSILTLYSFLNKSQNKFKYLTVLIAFGIAFSFNVFCPGNYVRIEEYKKIPMIESILIALANAMQMIRDLLFNTLFIPMLIIAFPSLEKIAKNSKVKFKNPILICILCFLCYMCFFVPMSYSYGNFYQETRVKNIQLFYLTLMVTFCIYCYLGYKKEETLIKHSNKCIALGFIALIFMTSSIGQNNMQGYILIDDLIYGNSHSYNKCMKKTNNILESDKKIVKIKVCKVYPRSMHYYIPQDEGWINDALSVYYGKKIRVEETE